MIIMLNKVRGLLLKSVFSCIEYKLRPKLLHDDITLQLTPAIQEAY